MTSFTNTTETKVSQSVQFPLDGIRVIDFTQIMLGPCATQMLGDLGADVIKIERPGKGDLSRNTFGGKTEAQANNPIFYSLNRNKRSVELDIRSDDGRAAVLELMRTADIVVSNFRPGVMERLGFGYAALSQINPGIICASGSGFGATGPYVHKGGQDVLAQAMSGVMEQRADTSIPRSIYPTALCDYTAGMHLVQGVLAALLARAKTGRGQEVKVSLYDSMIAMQMQEAAFRLSGQETLNWAAMPLTGVFETSDGALVLVGAFKAHPLRDICAALGIEDLSPSYPDYDAQMAAKSKLQGLFRDHFSQNTTAFWIGRLEAQDLLCAPVRSLGDALTDPQTLENEMIAQFDHPVHGTVQVVATPVHLSDVPFTIRRAAPRLGEHTQEVLAEIGAGTMASRASA